jgi:tetratricopeptide (TPR) repeat protein
MPDTGTTTAFEAGYQAGQSIGVLIVCLLIFLPALHCFLIFRRPATNAKCVLSLGILTSSILLAAIIGVATRNHPNLIWLGGVAGLALFAALIGAIVLAIIGLVEYHGRKGQYNQGKIHAIITLALCSLFFCLMILAAYKGFEKARLRAVELKTQQSKPDEWLTFEDMNFRFKVPPKPWVQLNAKKLNTNCTVAFMNARPEVYVMVIPEKVGDGQISTDSLVEIVIAKLRSNTSSVRILKQTPDTRHGLNGVQLEVTARAANYDLRYGFWMCATNGYLYQVIAYGRADQADAVREKSKEMFSRFELIDYQRVAPRLVNVASKDFQSTNFQYSVRVAHSAFRPSPTMARSVPAAEFCAWDETSSVGVFVIPVFMMDQHPELEALTQALLGLMEISYPNDDISHEKQITEGNLKGIGFSYERVNSYGKYSYRIKVLKGQGYGYLAGAFDLPKGKDDAKILEEALARVEFPTEPAPPVKSQDFNSRERDRHALVFNQLGLFYYKTRHYENSATYFKLAFEFDRKNSVYLQNFLNASSNLGRHREALDYLEDNPATLAASRQLRAAQAFLELQLQQTDQAVTNFAAVFAEGYQNDDYFTQYINLLSQTKQQDVAIAAVQKYLEQKDSLTVRLLQAHLYSQKKEYTKAINLLKVQREKFPFNSELSLALADDFFHSGLYRESVEICQRLTDDQTDSGAVFYLKGCGEFGLKRYREAKTAFEIALKKIPNSP